MRAWVHPIARELDERPLSVDEFDERLRRTLADDRAMQELRDLVAWFRRRYPTAEERLAYVRRKYRAIAAEHLATKARRS